MGISCLLDCAHCTARNSPYMRALQSRWQTQCGFCHQQSPIVLCERWNVQCWTKHLGKLYECPWKWSKWSYILTHKCRVMATYNVWYLFLESRKQASCDHEWSSQRLDTAFSLWFVWVSVRAHACSALRNEFEWSQVYETRAPNVIYM